MQYLLRIVLAIVLLVTSVQAQAPRHWQRSIKVEPRSTADPREVQLAGVGQRDILLGDLYVKNELPESDSPGSVMIIEGHQKRDGTFWPTAELQVQKGSAEWIRIGSSGTEQPFSHLRIYSGTMATGLRINLGPFKPYLNDFKFGRILFKSGYEVLIKLDDLKPPSDEKINKNQERESSLGCRLCDT